MENNWLSLIPPLIVLISAFISKRILFSLILGIISAALIATNFSIFNAATSILNETFDQFKDIQNYLFFGLLYVLGIIIALIEKTGGAQALGQLITKKTTSKKAVETSCLILSMSLFIDDYLNVLTVGNVMRSVTDKFHIPRVKLAYLVATMAAPLVIITPISTWIGFIIGQLNAAGISLEASGNPIILNDPFFVYISFIPFVFYSILLIVSNWIIVRKKLSFGPMKKYENIASKTDNIFDGKKEKGPTLILEKESRPSLLDFLLPIISFILIILIGIPYSGGYHLFGGNNSLILAFQKSNAPLVLFLSSTISLIISLTSALIRKKIFLKNIPSIIHQGFKLMNSSIIMILFAWIFGGFIKQLNTGSYIASLLIGAINIKFIPVMIFITSLIITLAIGSTWGSIAIMVPLVVTIFPPLLKIAIPTTINNLFILLPSLGATFSGALAGNHLSPISDSTIMSTASTGAYAIDLVKARFWYVLSPIIATGIAYFVTGLLINQNIYLMLLTSIMTGILCVFILLKLTQVLFKIKNNK